MNHGKLTNAIESFDGKAVADLERAFRETKFGPEIVDLLLNKVADGSQNEPGAASWLLKRAADDGYVFSAKAVNQIVKLLGGEVDWGTALHLLQITGSVTIPRTRAHEAFSTFSRFSRSRKTTHRAWSLNALHSLAEHHPKYRPEVSKLLEAALKDDSAAVKARIRLVARSSKFFTTPKPA